MRPRDARGRFRKSETAARKWTILATDRRHSAIYVVNRRRDRVISRQPSTEIRFATQAEADDYLARLPIHPRWSFVVDSL